MTRIIAGRHRGRRLLTPRGSRTRPTADRVRQVLFDVLGAELAGCRFLDPFAGSGGVGLEALSRGASEVVLVEKSSAALRVLRANVERLGASDVVELFRQDALAALETLARAGRRFDVVYLDPPYQSALAVAALERIAPCDSVAGRDLLAAGGVVVAERFHKDALPETIGRLSRHREIRVGDHTLSFYRRGPRSAQPPGEPRA